MTHRAEFAGSIRSSVTKGHNAQEVSSLHGTVLCVQPTRSLHDALQRALENYDVTVVGNAFEAIRRFNASAFDAYILDYWVPDWSGVQLCRAIRRTDPHVPIIFCVCATSEDQQKKAIRAGANAYLSVSSGLHALCQKLDSLIQTAELRNTGAKAVEERVILEEFRKRVIGAVSESQRAKGIAPGAIERVAKLKAQKAFVEAGGTQAYFERFWRVTFQTAVANLQTSCFADHSAGERQ